MSFRPCVVIPTYNNPITLGAVVAEAQRHVQDIIVVDDGCFGGGREAVDAVAKLPGVSVHRHAKNAGKGAAVKTGIRSAAALGFSHVLQVDAYHQHQLADIPGFLSAGAADPSALVLGSPKFDSSAPTARLLGRRLTNACVQLETGGRVIADPMCGFRVYPVAAALAVLPGADRMDFDPEIAVRLVWYGLRVVNLETEVRYLSVAEGGVSHFQIVRDNARISWMHTRLLTQAVLRLLTGRKLRSGTWQAPAG